MVVDRGGIAVCTGDQSNAPTELEICKRGGFPLNRNLLATNGLQLLQSGAQGGVQGPDVVQPEGASQEHFVQRRGDVHVQQTPVLLGKRKSNSAQSGAS